MDSRSLLKRTVRWAWERDETGQPTTRQTVGYLLTLYGVAFGLTIAAGIGFWVYGNRMVGFGLLIFGTWFTAFIGAVNVGWEWLSYRAENRPTESPQGDDGPQRELAITFGVRDETKIGFVVTVFGLVVLFLTYELAVFVISLL